MGLIKDWKAFRALQRRRRQMRAYYASAKPGRLNADWSMSGTHIFDILRSDLKTLRARARDAERNNDHVRRFLGMVETNVVGPTGIRYRSRARNSDGAFDRIGNDAVDNHFLKWGRPDQCTVDGYASWHDCLKATARGHLRDGETFWRIIEGFDNKYGFALQQLDPDDCPEHLNDPARRIVMGIELDGWLRPIAYWFRDSDGVSLAQGERYTRYPADKIIHTYIRERPRQIRGVTFMASALQRLHMLNGMEDAILVGTRAAACKMGFLQSNNDYSGDDTDNLGNPIQEAEPGIIERIGPDDNFIPYDPGYPPAGYDEYVKAVLRGVAGGLNVTYNSLANDLEGVNYSSIRWGGLDERDSWRMLSRHLIDHFCHPVGEAWLFMSMMKQAITLGDNGQVLPFERFSKFNHRNWLSRGWRWVDPLKEINAIKLAIEMKLISRTQAAQELGYEFEEVLEQLEAEQQLVQAHIIPDESDNAKSKNNADRKKL